MAFQKSFLIFSWSFLIVLPIWAIKGVANIGGTTEASSVKGTVMLEETKKGLKISAKLEGVPAGNHGFHIHTFGDCGNSGKNAGGHYNPKKTKHGFLMKDGIKKAHGGDMGNLKAGKNGKASLELEVHGVYLTSGKNNVGGRAFILHAKPDDFGQPTGNAGARIGCGNIVLVGE